MSSIMVSEVYTCELDPETRTTLQMYLFKNVRNVEVIRNNIVKGVWNCAIIKPSLILHPLQVSVAANRAAVAQKHNTMVTRTVFAEILYNLSLTKNITQSLSKFGIEKDSNLLVCFLITPDGDDSKEIIQQIEGELCPISNLSQYSNEKDIKAVYKLNNVKGDLDLLDVIVSRMVTKNIVSH
ncbi:EKC/KEOPS complex subunit TPRKB-like [Achroia grisella]|uniref:EKC/KEOPS complex subunit TPRKB-like n=1 Tax=Achroia grisella TaxID=688607 RepID=UPI0027D30993|nr:EKC/KEOPS complex subunit TPRKB-like [Achroia grisella]